MRLKEIRLDLSEHKRIIDVVCDALTGTKLDIIECLGDELGQTEIAEKLACRPGNVSYHLNSLEEAEIISRRKGKGLKDRSKKIPTLEVGRIIINLVK